MKSQFKIIFALMTLFFDSAFSAGVTFTFANGQITGGAPKYKEFDIMAAASAGGTKIGDGQVYFNYNTAGFGSNIYGSGKITVTKGTLIQGDILGSPLYDIISVADNTASRIAVTYGYNYEASPSWANNLPASATQILHIKIEIFDENETAGLSFEQTSMDGQIYESDNSTKYNPVTASDTDDESLPVEMGNMMAIFDREQGVKLVWHTESETNSAGFHILRSTSENGGYKKITTTLIPSQGNGSAQSVYTFIDRNVLDGKEYWYKIEEVGIDGMNEVFGPISVTSAPLPTEYDLSQNYPNPFNPETSIKYELPEIAEVTVKVYTLLGMEIRVLVNKIQNAGRYTLTWNGTDNGGRKLPSGIYFLRMQAGAFSQIRKMTFIQ